MTGRAGRGMPGQQAGARSWGGRIGSRFCGLAPTARTLPGPWAPSRCRDPPGAVCPSVPAACPSRLPFPTLPQGLAPLLMEATAPGAPTTLYYGSSRLQTVVCSSPAQNPSASRWRHTCPPGSWARPQAGVRGRDLLRPHLPPRRFQSSHPPHTCLIDTLLPLGGGPSH